MLFAISNRYSKKATTTFKSIPALLILLIHTPSTAGATSTSPSPEPSPFPTLKLSNAPSRSNKASIWEDISSFEQYEPLPTKATALKLNDDATKVVTLGFDFNWFGETVTEVCLSSNGQINMGETCDSSQHVKPIGSYNGARIALVQQNLNPRAGGTVKYLFNSSPASLKVSFEDVKFYDGDEGGIGSVQSQVELFANGDIIFCYGDGDLGLNYFAAGVEDSRCHVAYPIPDAPFDADGIAKEWPKKKCWKFHMPAECPSMAPSLSPSVSSIFEISLSNTVIILTSKGFHMHPNRCL